MSPTSARTGKLIGEATAVNGKALNHPVLPRGEHGRDTSRVELWKSRVKVWGREAHHWENNSDQQY
jgi:hypothetical protein